MNNFQYLKNKIQQCKYVIIQNNKKIKNLKEKIFELEKTNNLFLLEKLELISELEKLKKIKK
jgi:hypothetical protein